MCDRKLSKWSSLNSGALHYNEDVARYLLMGGELLTFQKGDSP